MSATTCDVYMFGEGTSAVHCGRPADHAGEHLVQPSAEEHAASLGRERAQRAEAPAFDLTAIRARAIADPGKPAGTCRWCGVAFDGQEDRICNSQGHLCSLTNEADVACADRAALLAELDWLHDAIADFIKRARGTIHGQRNGDADEVLR